MSCCAGCGKKPAEQGGCPKVAEALRILREKQAMAATKQGDKK